MKEDSISQKLQQITDLNNLKCPLHFILQYFGDNFSRKVLNIPKRGVMLSQGCRRFETSVFFSVKINISTTGGFRVGFFQPDTNHP